MDERRPHLVPGSPEGARPGGRPARAISRWQVYLAMVALTGLVVGPLAAWDRGVEPIKAEGAGEAGRSA